MERLEGLSKIEFKEVLSLATKQSYFIFNPTKVGGLGGWGVGVHGPMSPPPANLFVITGKPLLYQTSPDAPRLLIKFIWAHINHAAKTF